MKPGWRHWTAALVVATALHAALGVVFMTSDRPTGDTKAGRGEVEISLSVAAPTATAEPVRGVEAELVEEVEIATGVVEARPIDPTGTVLEVVPVESAAEFVAIAATDPSVPLRAVSEAPPAPVQTVAPQGTAALSTDPSSNTTTDGKSHRADYFSRLRAWLERHKKYPRNARLRRQEGTVTVRFTVQPSGRLQSYAIERGSGFTLLDREALAMLQRASPLPAIPESVGHDSLELVLPVSFYLR